jgi:hypothetical protein
MAKQKQYIPPKHTQPPALLHKINFNKTTNKIVPNLKTTCGNESESAVTVDA